MSFLAILTYTYCKFALDFLACCTPGRKALGLVEKRKEITIYGMPVVCFIYDNSFNTGTLYIFCIITSHLVKPVFCLIGIKLQRPISLTLEKSVLFSLINRG